MSTRGVAGALVVVSGTGTNVGKTTFTAALLRALRLDHVKRTAIGFKPIETGGTADADALGRASGTRLAPSFAFEVPVSPHLAARAEGRVISVVEIARRVSQLRESCDLLVVETAGGLFTPIVDRTTNADLTVALAPDAHLLVAPNRLGVLHDCNATVRASMAMSLPITAVILSDAPAPGPERDQSLTSNRAALEEQLGVPVLGREAAAAAGWSFVDRLLG